MGNACSAVAPDPSAQLYSSRLSLLDSSHGMAIFVVPVVTQLGSIFYLLRLLLYARLHCR